MDSTEQWLFVANYTGQTHCAWKILPDASIGNISSFFKCEGKGPRAEQECAHPHEVMLYGENDKFAVVCDLGSDKWRLYEFDNQTGVLKPNSYCEHVSAAPGSGPRHIKFSSDGKFAYSGNEHSNTVSVFEVNTQTGVLKEIQTLSSIDENSPLPSYIAEVHISEDGKFLYVSNRAKEDIGSIAVFEVHEKTGILKLIQIASTLGRFPRYFELAGNFVIVAHQHSNDITVLQRDVHSGKIADSSSVFVLKNIEKPTCIAFL